MPVGEKQTYRFGPFELDTQCGQLRREGVGLKLQGQPVQILEILLQKPGQLVTRDELRERLWSVDTFVDFDHSLNTAIKKLRKELGDEADTPQYIETLPRRGYRFVGGVSAGDGLHKDSGTDALARDEFVTKIATTLIDAAIHNASDSRRRVRLTFWAVAIFAALMTVIAAAYRLTTPPMPRVVDARPLTSTVNRKAYPLRPMVDRGSLYFLEEQQFGIVNRQVSTTGGEERGGPITNGLVMDISRDGTQLLFLTGDPVRPQHDVWAQPLPAGTPRLIVKDASVPIWSADGRDIFFTNGTYTALYRAKADGTGIQPLATLPFIKFPHLSPDGKRVRFSANASTIWEVRVDGEDLHPILDGRRNVLGGSWSPDGAYYFFTGWDGERWSLWAVSEARHWWNRHRSPIRLTAGPMSFLNPAISKDGQHLYAAGAQRRGELSVYDRNVGRFVPFLSGISVSYVDFSRDGQWITYVAYPEGTLWRSRVDGTDRRQLTDWTRAVVTPRWSPDGKLIAFTEIWNGDRPQTTGSERKSIYLISADGGGPMLLLAGNFGNPAWSPDSKSIAYDATSGFSSDLRILDLGTQKSTTVPESQDMWYPRWSPDGHYLAALRGDPPRKLMLFDFAHNVWNELAASTSTMFHSPCWSRDSKSVYVTEGFSLVRIDVAEQKTEEIASLAAFRYTANFTNMWDVGWLGLTPDDSPMTTRDTGIQEIYVLDLEYR